MLFAPERTTLLDHDTLAAGDPALDYANFLAHLTLRGLQEPSKQAAVAEGKQAFRQAYGDTAAGFADNLPWWEAGTLMRLAILYRLRPRWRQLSRALLAAASEAAGMRENL